MSRKRGRPSKLAQDKPSRTLLPNGRSLRSKSLQTNRSLLLLVGVVLLAGIVLLSWRGSTGNENHSAQASLAKPPVPSASPTPVATGRAGAVTPANGAPNAVPKQQRLAEPKSIIPAPPVVTMTKGPRIAFTNEEIDFGNVEFGDVVRVAFEFKNVGSEPLTISGAQVEAVEGC